jgi:hypothetical protein
MTLAPLRYWSAVADRYFDIPAEFITDLASVPRLPFAYLLTGDRARGPAVVHDWLYQSPSWGDRALADAIFDEAMGVDQPEIGYEAEDAVIRGLMYSGVRAGGWKAWAAHGKRASELNPIWSSTAWPEIPQAA